MITIAIALHVPIVIAGIHSFKIGAHLSAKASDAKALDRNPANVIPI